MKYINTNSNTLSRDDQLCTFDNPQCSLICQQSLSRHSRPLSTPCPSEVECIPYPPPHEAGGGGYTVLLPSAGSHGAHVRVTRGGIGRGRAVSPGIRPPVPRCGVFKGGRRSSYGGDAPRVAGVAVPRGQGRGVA